MLRSTLQTFPVMQAILTVTGRECRHGCRTCLKDGRLARAVSYACWISKERCQGLCTLHEADLRSAAVVQETTRY